LWSLLVSKAKSEICLIPDNYSGEILVFFDQRNGIPPNIEGRERIYQIPESSKISIIYKKPYYYTDADENEYLFRAERFIISKRKDFEKYNVEIKTDSIIENVFNDK